MFSYYVTHRCNLGCRYCCDGDGKRFKEDPVPELDSADARRLLSILRQAGDTLDITGGEPLLRDDLEEILAHARAIGLRTVLNTKGIGLADRPDLLRHTSVLVLSLDTLDPDLLAEADRPAAGRWPRRFSPRCDYRPGRLPPDGTKLVLAAVATPDNLDRGGRGARFRLDHGLGFQLSPEIVGTSVNPALRDNAAYRQLIDRTLAEKRSQRGVLGVPAVSAGNPRLQRFPLPSAADAGDSARRPHVLSLPGMEAGRDQPAGGRQLLSGVGMARRRFGEIPACRDCCHIFCHMALSLLQSHPLSAMGELKALEASSHEPST